MLLLHNAPKLKALRINSVSTSLETCLIRILPSQPFIDHVPLSWNQPSSVPRCVLSHLEIFEWKLFEGRREEKQLLAYILENSKCLKTVEISLIPFTNVEEKKKIREDLESMYRVSASSQLLLNMR